MVDQKEAKTFYDILDSKSIEEIIEILPEPQSIKKKAVSTINDLNLRIKPGLQENIIGCLRAEETVFRLCQTEKSQDIDGFYSYWYYVYANNGRKGWVFGGYLKEII